MSDGTRSIGAPVTDVILRWAPDVVVRPMADASLALVGDGRPFVLDGLHERIMAVCVRATDRDELIDVLGELDEFDDSMVSAAVAELVDRGLLRST